MLCFGQRLSICYEYSTENAEDLYAEEGEVVGSLIRINILKFKFFAPNNEQRTY